MIFLQVNTVNTTLPNLGIETSISILILILSIISILITSIVFYIIIKRGIIGQILNRKVIFAYIIGKDRRINKRKVILKSITSKLTPSINDARYIMIPKYMFLTRNTPSWMYRQGNPKPLDIEESVLTTNISDTELNEAIESKVIADLLKLSYVGMEKIILLLLIGVLGVSVISIYYLFTMNSDITAIINHLLQQQTNTPTQVPIVPIP